MLNPRNHEWLELKETTIKAEESPGIVDESPTLPKFNIFAPEKWMVGRRSFPFGKTSSPGLC